MATAKNQESSPSEDITRIAAAIENGNVSEALIEELKEIAEKVKKLEK